MDNKNVKRIRNGAAPMNIIGKIKECPNKVIELDIRDKLEKY